MAVATVTHGDLVLVHANALNVHGLFTVDSVEGTDVFVRPPDGSAASRVKLSDICAVYSASSTG
jgi:hypothetical protein